MKPCTGTYSNGRIVWFGPHSLFSLIVQPEYRDVFGLIVKKLDPVSVVMLCYAFGPNNMRHINWVYTLDTIFENFIQNGVMDAWMDYRAENALSTNMNHLVVRAILNRDEKTVYLLSRSSIISSAFRKQIYEIAIKNEDVESLGVIIRNLPYENIQDMFYSAVKNNQVWTMQRLIAETMSSEILNDLHTFYYYRQLGIIKNCELKTFQLLYARSLIDTSISDLGKYERYDIMYWVLKEKCSRSLLNAIHALPIPQFCN
tara:strand:- start:2320 stop:3093 length:774 start_codon:yes stop_codon:yes gene_type:complete